MKQPQLTCRKTFGPYPLAHRLHRHDGHCQQWHGHSTYIVVEFAAKQRDACGFIMDFGKMECVKKLLSGLDHSLVIAMDDPFYPFLRQAAADYQKKYPQAAPPYRPVVVLDPSAEGMALHLAKELNLLVQHETNKRVRVKSVQFYEELSSSAEAVL